MKRDGASVQRSHGSPAAEIVGAASQRARVFGTVSIPALAVAVDLSEAEVRAALAGSPAVFLDADWFWLPGRSSRLEASSRRMLAVSSTLDVASLRAGASRALSRGQPELLPPADVMAALYDSHPAFVLDPPCHVQTAEPLDWRTELREADRVFVETLRSSWTGVLERDTLRDACLARGMTARTFAARTAHSEVLDNPVADIWCLRGTRVSPITAAALRHAKTVDTA